MNNQTYEYFNNVYSNRLLFKGYLNSFRKELNPPSLFLNEKKLIYIIRSYTYSRNEKKQKEFSTLNSVGIKRERPIVLCQRANK